MKKSIFVVMICAITAVSAFGNPAPDGSSPHLGGWSPDAPRTTHQFWDFDGPYTTGDFGVYEYNFSPATETTNEGTTSAFVHGVLATADVIGNYFVAGQDGVIDVELEISNFPGGAWKEGWVYVDCLGDVTNISVLGHGGSGTTYTSKVVYSDNQFTTFGFFITPNPDKEDIFFSIVGTEIVDPTHGGTEYIAPELYSIHVDTICNTVPAPGAFALVGLGTGLVGWIRRRIA